MLSCNSANRFLVLNMTWISLTLLLSPTLTCKLLSFFSKTCLYSNLLSCLIYIMVNNTSSFHSFNDSHDLVFYWLAGEPWRTKVWMYAIWCFLEFIIIYICLFKLLIRRKIIDDLMFLSGLPFDRFSIPNLFWHPQKLLQMQIMLQFLELLVMRLVML